MTVQPPVPAALTWTGVTARRIARHALTELATGLGPAELAGVLCGAHAQVLSAAELSIGRRIAAGVRTDVQRALRGERRLSIPPRYAAELFGNLAGELEYAELDGQPGWTLTGDTKTPARPHRGVQLLPYFDAYIVAGQPATRCIPARPPPARSLRRAKRETTQSCHRVRRRLRAGRLGARSRA